MEEKLPDYYVENRNIKHYPTEIGSQPFKPDEIELFTIDKTNKLKTHFSTKFNELKQQYEELMEDIKMNERIYKSKYSFTPIVGQEYYLYYDGKGGEFLSIITPTEWKNKFELIGVYQLNSDSKWVDVKKN